MLETYGDSQGSHQGMGLGVLDVATQMMLNNTGLHVVDNDVRNDRRQKRREEMVGQTTSGILSANCVLFPEL